MSKDDNATSLSTILGSGIDFEVKGKTYTVLPIMVAHIEQFRKSGIFMTENQIFNFYDEKVKKSMNKWLGGEEVIAKVLGKDITARYLFDENNEPMSLEKTMVDGWDVVDYKRYFKTLCDLSG